MAKTERAKAQICCELENDLVGIPRNAYQANNDKIVIYFPYILVQLPRPQPEDDGNECDKGEDG